MDEVRKLTSALLAAMTVGRGAQLLLLAFSFQLLDLKELIHEMYLLEKEAPELQRLLCKRALRKWTHPEVESPQMLEWARGGPTDLPLELLAPVAWEWFSPFASRNDPVVSPSPPVQEERATLHERDVPYDRTRMFRRALLLRELPLYNCHHIARQYPPPMRAELSKQWTGLKPSLYFRTFRQASMAGSVANLVSEEAGSFEQAWDLCGRAMPWSRSDGHWTRAAGS